MFDLDLIARRLAQHEADVRYETSNAKSDMDREAWETHLDEATEACAEFARLRKALEDAPVGALHGWSVTDDTDPRLWAPAIFLPIDGIVARTRGPFPHRVRLVREDSAA